MGRRTKYTVSYCDLCKREVREQWYSTDRFYYIKDSGPFHGQTVEVCKECHQSFKDWRDARSRSFAPTEGGTR